MRLEILKTMVAAESSRQLSRYGLAMEGRQFRESRKGVEEYDPSLSLKSDYAAAYTRRSGLGESWGDIDDARRMYTRGLEVTKRIGGRAHQHELQLGSIFWG